MKGGKEVGSKPAIFDYLISGSNEGVQPEWEWGWSGSGGGAGVGGGRGTYYLDSPKIEHLVTQPADTHPKNPFESLSYVGNSLLIIRVSLR